MSTSACKVDTEYGIDGCCRGSVTVDHEGVMRADANFLGSSVDLASAIRALRKTVEVVHKMESAPFAELFEDGSEPEPCYFSVLNGLLEIAQALNMLVPLEFKVDLSAIIEFWEDSIKRGPRDPVLAEGMMEDLEVCC